MKSFVFLLIAAIITGSTYSQPGTVDVSFGNKGFVYKNTFGVHYAIAQQPDGKLLAAGGYDDPGGNIVRFLADGTIDSSFGNSGFAYGGEAYDMVLEAEGRILVCGSLVDDNQKTQFFVARYKPDGTPDLSFGENGITLTPYSRYDAYVKIALEPDGSIIIAGDGQTNLQALIPEYSILSHLSADGKFDYGFGDKSRVLNYTNLTQIHNTGLAIQKDGKILLAGFSFINGYQDNYVLCRYNSDGTPDAGFGSEGTVITDGLIGADVPCGIALQPDGRIVLGGSSSGVGGRYMAALRYETNGTLDKTFGAGGKSFVYFQGKESTATAVLLQPDGKVILSGGAFDYATRTTAFALCRLSGNGSLDSSFGIDGKEVSPYSETSSAFCATLQQDGKIVLGGVYYNEKRGYDSYLMVRYNDDKQQKPLIAKIKRFLHNHSIGWQGLDANISYYSVQYSKAGSSSFTEKGKVSGAGSNNFQQYNFDLNDAGYYRIVAVNRKGYKTYSNKVAVSEGDIASTASVFPNPAKNYVTVQGLQTNETANISISDGSGNIKAKGISAGSTQYRSQLTNLQPGTYYVNITTGTKTETLKFVKE